jgi:dTDP-4-dehydrorhamnose 3,5-epimerase
MQIIDTVLAEVKILVPRRISDQRGFFSEVWNARDFASAEIDAAFVQDNHESRTQPAQGHLARLALPSAASGARQAGTGDPGIGRGHSRRHSPRITNFRALLQSRAQRR